MKQFSESLRRLFTVRTTFAFSPLLSFKRSASPSSLCTTSLCGIIFIFIVKKFKKILHLSKTLPCPKPNSPSRMTSWDFEKGPRKLQILADFFKFKASPLLLTRPTPAKDSLHFIPTKKRLEKLPPLILPPSQGL